MPELLLRLNEKVKDAVPSLAIFCEEGLADRPATWPANSMVDGLQEAQTTAAKAKKESKCLLFIYE